MEEIISYQDTKDFVFDCMNAQIPGINPISYGSTFAIDEPASYRRFDDYELMESFIACGLFELKHHDLEERIEEQMTYWIYQYEHFGKFKDIIPDCDVMEADIAKIKSMMHLRFEDLACDEG